MTDLAARVAALEARVSILEARMAKVPRPVIRPGGRIGFVHYITPKPPDGTRFVKAFGLSTGFDMPIRAVTIFERDHPGLPFTTETP